jgi:hypothetical protein
MSHNNIERAFYLRKLLEKQLDKVDPKLSHKERMEAAKKKLDAKLGPEWRKEIEIDGDEKLSSEEAAPFYMRVMVVGDQEGLGPKGSEAPEEGERPEKDKKQIINQIQELLECLK